VSDLAKIAREHSTQVADGFACCPTNGIKSLD